MRDMSVAHAGQRSVDDLVDDRHSALPLVQRWIEESPRQVELLPTEGHFGEDTLLALQVTTRSTLGAIAFHSGGLLVDAGWVRVLGSGHHRLPRDLAGWNRLGAPSAAHRQPGALLVADDVLGGFFAVNGGGLPAEDGNVCYLSPDTLEWEDLGIGYTNWMCWLLTGPVTDFYEGTRWPGWEREVAALVPGHAFSVYPFLCMVGDPIARRSRRPVPIDELWRLHALELPSKLAGM